MRRKICAGTVVTLNERLDIWQPGYIIVDGQFIVEAGPGQGPLGDFDEVVDAGQSIVMPGLVNAHAHSPSNLVKGSWSRLPLEIWRQYIRAAWREYSDEALYVSAQLGAIEMLKTGCTSVLDHFYSGSSTQYMGALNVVNAMIDIGIKGGVALTLSDESYEATVGLDPSQMSSDARQEMNNISRYETAVTLDDFKSFFKHTKQMGDGVIPIIGPSAPHRCSKELLQLCSQTAEELDTTIHIHVAETKGQAAQGLKVFGKPIVRHLNDIGVLNERLSMAHCVWLSDEEIDLIAKKGSIVIHNPASNGKLGSGKMRFIDMLRAGVRIGLATDGSGSNDTQNVFEAMRLAGVIHNGNDYDFLDWPTSGEVLRAATQGGASALGWSGRVGSISPSMAADLVVLTTDSFHFTPLNDVSNQLVFCENGMSVRSTMADGRWVLKDGLSCLIDERKLYERARDLRKEMDERLKQQFKNTSALEGPLRQSWLATRNKEWTNESGMGSF